MLSEEEGQGLRLVGLARMRWAFEPEADRYSLSQEGREQRDASEVRSKQTIENFPSAKEGRMLNSQSGLQHSNRQQHF